MKFRYIIAALVLFATGLFLALSPNRAVLSIAQEIQGDTEESSNEAVPAPQGFAQAPEGAEKILEESASFLAAKETISFDFQTTVLVEQRGRPNKTLIEGRLVLGKENLGMFHLKTAREEVFMYNGPESRVVYVPKENRYQTLPRQESRKELVATMMPGPIEPWWSWFADLLYGTVQVAESIEVVPGECGEAPCREVHVKMDKYTLRISYPAEGALIPLSASIVLEPELVKNYLRGSDAAIEATTVFSKWRLDVEVDESVFAFAPPEGVQEVSAQSPRARIEVGNPAPDFTLELLGGGSASLKDHLGKDVVILDFWASWCGPCRRAMPMVVQVAEQFEGKNVQLYAVNLRETPEIAEAFLKGQNLSVPVLLDKSGIIAGLYDVSGIPKLVIVGKDGLIKSVHRGMGPNMVDQLSREIQELL